MTARRPAEVPPEIIAQRLEIVARSFEARARYFRDRAEQVRAATGQAVPR